MARALVRPRKKTHRLGIGRYVVLAASSSLLLLLLLLLLQLLLVVVVVVVVAVAVAVLWLFPTLGAGLLGLKLNSSPRRSSPVLAGLPLECPTPECSGVPNPRVSEVVVVVAFVFVRRRSSLLFVMLHAVSFLDPSVTHGPMVVKS